jgi:hypothetical protein
MTVQATKRPRVLELTTQDSRLTTFHNARVFALSEDPRAVEPGLALIAVLVALGILLGLVVPFILSMGHGEAAAIQRVDEAQVDISSASVRDLLLERVTKSHVALDQTPGFDSASEFPAQVALPEALSAFAENGRQLIGGEAEDTQRRINLNTASPLVLGNLLGLVARLSEACPADGERLVLDDASTFPEAGTVIVDREVIRYGRRTDNELLDLQRGLRSDEGFAPSAQHELVADSLVLDARVVLAVTYPFWERHDGARDKLVPYLAVSELARLASTPHGSFTLRELDVLESTCTVASVHEIGGNWGKPERVFSISPEGHILQVRSAAFLAGGTVVRVRKVHEPEGTGEYNLVWSVEAPAGDGLGTVNLPRRWYLNLLRPLAKTYEPIDTIVEPLVPPPVNVNTASRDVLVAALLNLRQGRRVRPAQTAGQPGENVHGRNQRAEQFGPPIARARAEEIVDRILQIGGRHETGDEVNGQQEEGIGPYESFEDFEKRLMKPLLADTKGSATQQLMLVYQNALSGRDGNLEMGTVPFGFSSAPVVSYRAAASRNKVAGQVAARHERQGTALVVPSRALDVVQATQEAFEETFRLDRRAPFFTTYPINVGALIGGDRGTDPAPRHVAHLLADAYPELGFGQARFPSRDGNGAGFKPAPASTPLTLRFAVHEDMAMSLDPDGRNVSKEGAYEMENTGPQSRGGQPSTGSGRHDKKSFPFTSGNGVAPTGIAFWFRLDDTGPQALFDLAADQATRDRIKLSVQDNNLHFKVFDAAGVDPDGSSIDTAPELCAGQWKVPLAGDDGFKIEAKVWYHASLSARGNRPGQFALLIDGVPRGEAEFRTYLVEDLPAFQPDRSGRLFTQDAQRFLSIGVESTKGFPDAGVLRVGLELFEYTSKDEKNFYCDYKNSRGGRLARMDAAEFRPEIPVDKNGKPTKSIEDLTGNAASDATPAHQNGAAVELYGYSIPVLRNAIWYPGAARLAEDIGAFAVARVINNRTPVGQRGPVALGMGLDTTTVEDLQLGNPTDMTDPSRPQPATSPVIDAFPKAGGYALLVQVHLRWIYWDGYTIDTGGVEIIRYGRRDNDRLTGIQRAVSLPTVTPNNELGFDGQGRNFVCLWDPIMRFRNGNYYNALKHMQTYVVPLSIPVSGQVADPRSTGWTEWVQLFEKSDESKTEWVRYDYFDGRDIVRARLNSLHAVRFEITRQTNSTAGQMARSGATVDSLGESFDYEKPPDQLRSVGIGSLEAVAYDHPVTWRVQRALQFRGDWGTSCRAHPANVEVLPVHRAELDWGNYGALSGRMGRNDRIALVEGTAGPGGSLDWHTVNWSGRRFGFDPQNLPQGAEKLGPHPFQLVGLKASVTGAFTGPADRDHAADARLLDRVVKFPSGELPSAYPDRASFGSALARDDRQMRGTLDELAALSHRVPSLILDSDLSQTAQEILVRNDATVESFGVVVREGVTNELPQAGGMLMIDGELIAYEGFNGSTIRVARKGRGQLATKARAHDEGTLVHFLEHVPVAILASAVNENTYQFATNGLGALPRFGGTVLMGSEVLHYTWTHGDQLLEMPSYIDPTSESKAKRGLFRGRYGTTPYSAQSGEPLIGIPFRQWDRYRERTEDPELSYFQVTCRQGSAYFTELMWREDNDEQKLVDLQCLVRLDGKGGFADDPSAGPNFRKFEHGTVDDRGNKIDRQAETLEARFFVTYRSGAFDPVGFLVHGWKKAPIVTGVVLSFEGEPRILEERVTAR